jgi:coproporphyrinogen III oxidase-like Fe-S oxidoreductase
VRWKNLSGIQDYIDRIAAGAPAAAERRALSAAERLGDALFTGLRLADGLDDAGIEARYGVDIWRRYGSELTPFLESGLLVREAGRTRLSRQGMLLAHEVMTVFV